MRAIAIDWSGAADAGSQRRRIWAAEARDGELRRLSAGRTRQETIDALLDDLEKDPATVVGLDFGFAFPAWWSLRHGAGDGPAVWELTRARGEEWLASCPSPFWGRPDHPRPAPVDGQSAWRRTERELATAGLHPKSVFQIGGAGAVGTGSIRGMPHLLRLHAAGVAVWPFDPWPAASRPGVPVVAEVYPRCSTGPVVKSRAGARATHLSTAYPGMAPALAEAAVASEDAFDAACTAVSLSFAPPPHARPAGAVDRLEGRVLPAGPPAGIVR